MYNLVIFMHIKEIMMMIKKNLIKKMPCGINISPCLITPSAICQKSQIYDIFGTHHFPTHCRAQWLRESTERETLSLGDEIQDFTKPSDTLVSVWSQKDSLVLIDVIIRQN